jgi:hypothetical protein
MTEDDVSNPYDDAVTKAEALYAKVEALSAFSPNQKRAYATLLHSLRLKQARWNKNHLAD